MTDEGYSSEREVVEMLRFAQHNHAVGNLSYADQIFQLILLKQPSHKTALLDYSKLCFQMGNFDKSKALVDQLIAAHDDIADAYFLRATLRKKSDEASAAVDDIAKALALREDYIECHHLLCELEMKGPEYKSLFRKIHKLLTPGVYCEIGVENGSSLKLAKHSSVAVGIDPAPRIAEQLPDNTHIFPMPSDDFFAGSECVIFAEAKIELGFIDGLHEARQALRDFINIERHSSGRAIIMLHDVIPLNAATATPQRNTLFWSGDVWRTLMAISHFFSDLEIVTIKSPPTGLALVKGANPGRGVTGSDLSEMYSFMDALSYADIQDRKAEALNVIPYSEADLFQFLQR